MFFSPPIGGDTTPSISPPNFFVPPNRFSCPPHFSGFFKFGGEPKFCKNHVPPNFGGDSSNFFCFPPSLGGTEPLPNAVFPPIDLRPPQIVCPPQTFLFGGEIFQFLAKFWGEILSISPPIGGDVPPKVTPQVSKMDPFWMHFFSPVPRNWGEKNNYAPAGHIPRLLDRF